ncbi:MULTISPECIES: hypothetical protein [unclassified Bacillus (in: firmicutes)]|uniref:hypothetical protein n=1 Tax=unclassified Bacillus (in: firmicutes) TaxID=185979 RepID=UPI000BF157B0|nr:MULTISPECIES: hypothetical protein [unclassified Bacillus (in: firmicutes)]PEJ47611.1 hypothetical protein CN692_24945 [Bacillus sp. AFS002410]PEL14088.1 hypothetical protein CN601_00650 [Bacillus sp. AFS017336]
MRINNRNSLGSGRKGVLNMDFHEFQNRGQETNSLEMASEFGLTLREVRDLKRQLERS